MRKMQIIKQAQRLLQESKYKELLLLLDSLEVERLDIAERGVFYLLLGEANLFLGNYKHDYPQLAINTFKNTNKHDQYAKAKYLRGWQLQMEGEYVDSRENLLEAYTSFLRADDKYWAARTLNRLSFICLQIGDTERAMNNLSKAILYYKEINNLKMYTVCMNNVAFLNMKVGRFSESLNLYSESKKYYSTIDNKNKCVFNIGYALVHALKNDIKSSKNILTEAYKILGNYKHEEAIFYEYSGWISLLGKDYDKAEKSLLKGLKLSLEIAPDSAFISQIKRLLGDLYLATNK